MKKAALLASSFLICAASSATTIQATVSSLGGTTWQYTYTVTNDALDQDIEEFTIFFDYTLYANLLAVTDTPAGWDNIEVQPDLGLPDDGFFDALALTGGIAPGQTVGGFSVVFDYLGSGSPGAQFFEIVDPQTFDVLDSGMTTIVPVPAAFWLLMSGVVGMGVFRRTDRK